MFSYMFHRWYLFATILYITVADIPEDFDESIAKEENIFDFNAILGMIDSSKFQKMTSEERKAYFSEIVDRIDANHDNIISDGELRGWIENVYSQVHHEHIEKEWNEINPNKLEKIDFDHYVAKVFEDRKSETHLKVIRDHRRRWITADLDNDQLLNRTEFTRFIHPEEFHDMKSIIAQETLEGMDKNNDSVIDINEYLKDIFPAEKETKEEWIRNERQNFGIDRDLNKDGVMDREEIQKWILPDTYDRVEAEIQHLMRVVDVDNDKILTKAEMVNNYEHFIGNYNGHGFDSPIHEDL